MDGTTMSIPNLEEFSSSSQSGDESKHDFKAFVQHRVGSRYDTEEIWRSAHQDEMTEEEKVRAEQRKENNKKAAKKSREKKKHRLDYLEKRAKELRSQRENLLSERRRLNEERGRLKDLLRQHASTCPGVRESLREKLAIY